MRRAGGDIFGDDALGSLIGSAYRSVFERADRAFTSSADDYEALGTAMHVVGRAHEETEANNAELLGRIRARLEGI